jgi:hypothetical protein
MFLFTCFYFLWNSCGLRSHWVTTSQWNVLSSVWFACRNGQTTAGLLAFLVIYPSLNYGISTPVTLLFRLCSWREHVIEFRPFVLHWINTKRPQSNVQFWLSLRRSEANWIVSTFHAFLSFETFRSDVEFWLSSRRSQRRELFCCSRFLGFWMSLYILLSRSVARLLNVVILIVQEILECSQCQVKSCPSFFYLCVFCLFNFILLNPMLSRVWYSFWAWPQTIKKI